MRGGRGRGGKRKKEVGLQMNEFMLRLLPRSRAGLVEEKWILTFQSLKLAVDLRL